MALCTDSMKEGIFLELFIFRKAAVRRVVYGRKHCLKERPMTTACDAS